jgi:polyhydroxyalkanoate synthase subunit PhaC
VPPFSIGLRRRIGPWLSPGGPRLSREGLPSALRLHLRGPDPRETIDRFGRFLRGMWVHASSPRPPVATTSHTVVHTHDKLAVRFYPRRGGLTLRSGPVVIVPSLINRATICDLEPGRSLVAGLADLGHDVYLVDWGVPGPEDADEDVGYVLLTLLHYSIRKVLRHAGASRVHLFGYCMGGTLAAMYAALRPGAIASLSTLAAPVRFADAGRFQQLVGGLDVQRAFPVGSLVPVEAMQPAFQLLDPGGALGKYVAIDEAASDLGRLRRTMVRERWLEENVPMSSAFAREFVLRGYQQDCLMNGTWDVRGEKVDLAAIRAPTLVVACERDFVAPLPAVTPLAERVPGARLEIVPSGHIGVVVGAFGPSTFYPMLDRFFREASP